MTEKTYVQLGNKIRGRTICIFYDIADEPDYFAKTLQDIRIKRYPLGITANYNNHRYNNLKYGIRDLIQYEYNLIQSFPQELKQYLPNNIQLRKSVSGRSVLCAEKVKDFDGKSSKFLSEYRKVTDKSFWKDIVKIADILRHEQLYLLNIFSVNSIMAQKLSLDSYKPVINSDIIKSGKDMYPFQIFLRFGPFLRWKFEAHFRRFLRKQMPMNCEI